MRVQKAKNALIVRKYLVEKEEAALDVNGYLKVSTKLLLKNMTKQGIISESHFNGIKNVLNKPEEITKFYDLAENVSQNIIRSDDSIDELIHKLILDSSKLDVLLYLSQKRYRDHYKHQFLVGMLGCFLLEVQMPDGLTIIEKIKSQTKLQEDEIKKAWWSAALLHDHGYPLSQILKSVLEINKLKSRIGNNHGFNQVINQMKNLFKVYRNIFSIDLINVVNGNNDINQFRARLSTLLTGLFAGIINDPELSIPLKTKDLFDHGVIGAANLLSLLREELGGDDGETISFINDNRWIQEAILAIKLHNSLDLCSNYNFNKHPIAFLLKLCDELQEWDRMTFYKDNIDADLIVETNFIKLVR